MLKKYSLFFLFSLFFWIPLSLIALGYSSNLFLLSIAYYSIFLILYLILRRYFAIIFLIHAVICSLYLPIAMIWGDLNVGMMESILRTNMQESFEFVSQTPLRYLISALLFFIISAFLAYVIWKNINFKNPQLNSKILKFGSGFLSLGIFIFCFNSFVIGDNRTILTIKENFYYKIIKIINFNIEDKKRFQEALKFKDNYQIIETKPNYKNYFLVIGESMRNDYTSLYGYPIDTTPFLRTIKGKVYENFVAASANTPTSLTRMLFWNKLGGKYKSYTASKELEQEQFIIFDNIVNLAKKANYKTTWISNHGQRGELDVATTVIAKIADDYYFSIKGSWQGISKLNVFDKNLLPVLKTKIQENKNNQKINLYVLHLIGSHEPYCKRVDFEKEKLLYKSPDERLSCYLHSITKTDEFLKNLDNLLKEEFNTDYSVLYFSDHGLAHLRGEYLLRHHYGFKQNYESPLVIFNGDDTEQHRIKVKKSGYNFIFAFAEWLGIREKNLEAENYTFFNNEDDKNIKVYNWDKDVDFDSLPRDIRFVEGVEKLNP